MRNIRAIFWKQIKDTLKNKTILIQFIMFPFMAFLMENAVVMEDMPEHFFVHLFAFMYVGMAPLVAMSAILAEEKEDCTLKVLLMSNVKPIEYLIGTGGYVWGACMIGSCALGLTGEYRGKEFAAFLGIMAAGIAASLLVGAAIGTASRNQMMATSLSIPVMMIVSFLPMLSMFNETINKMAKMIYSEQIRILIDRIGQQAAAHENIVILSVNMATAFFCFIFAYKKCGL